VVTSQRLKEKGDIMNDTNQTGIPQEEIGDESAEARSPSPAGSQDMISGPSKPFPGPVDFTKPVRTKGSKIPVRILAIDHGLTRPVVGVVLSPFQRTYTRDWSLNGLFTNIESSLDLENVPESPAASALEIAALIAGADPAAPRPSSSQPLALIWTKEKPSCEGYYWTQLQPGPMELVNIEEMTGQLIMFTTSGKSRAISVANPDREFAGPIPEPMPPSPESLGESK
jgi:hypothetical protein